MSVDLITVRTAIDAAMAALTTAKANLTAEPDAVVVRAGENLQAALDKRGAITLEAGATFAGTYTVRSDSVLIGRAGAVIRGTTGPALVVLPGAKHISVASLELSSAHSEVCALGENYTAQTRLEDVPDDITLTDVRIPTHRGKRAFAIHASHVQLLDCEALDCWDPGGQDSQAIYIGNTPGPITIRGGRYSAGSDVILLGGDTMRIPNVTPTDVLVEGVELFRPLSWRTDGVARKVKNIFEVKNGVRVTLRKSVLSGCWANGQQGEAIVLTPALDGAKTTPPLRSGDVTDILIEDVTIRDCSTVANMLGRAYSAFTVHPLAGVIFRRVDAIVSRATYGGRGQLATIGGEPLDVTFDDCNFTGDGSSLIYYYPGDVLDPVTKVSRAGRKIGRLTLTGSRCTLGEYSIMLGGYANARNWSESVGALTVTGNTFTGSRAMQAALPDNVYA